MQTEKMPPAVPGDRALSDEESLEDLPPLVCLTEDHPNVKVLREEIVRLGAVVDQERAWMCNNPTIRQEFDRGGRALEPPFGGEWAFHYDDDWDNYPSPEQACFPNWHCTSCHCCCSHAQERAVLIYAAAVRQFHQQNNEFWQGKPFPYAEVYKATLSWQSNF